MALSKKRWTEVSDLPMSVEAVREISRADTLFRVYPRVVPKGASFAQTIGLRVDEYVKSGRLTYETDNDCIEVSAGEFVSLGKGSYLVSALGDADVEIIKAVHAPAEFVPKS
jgi:hypothetical protein